MFLQFPKGMYKNFKEGGIIQAVSRLTVFVNMWISMLRSSLHYKKIHYYETLGTVFRVRSLILVHSYFLKDVGKILGFVNYQL